MRPASFFVCILIKAVFGRIKLILVFCRQAKQQACVSGDIMLYWELCAMVVGLLSFSAPAVHANL